MQWPKEPDPAVNLAHLLASATPVKRAACNDIFIWPGLLIDVSSVCGFPYAIKNFSVTQDWINITVSCQSGNPAVPKFIVNISSRTTNSASNLNLYQAHSIPLVVPRKDSSYPFSRLRLTDAILSRRCCCPNVSDSPEQLSQPERWDHGPSSPKLRRPAS